MAFKEVPNKHNAAQMGPIVINPDDNWFYEQIQKSSSSQ